MERYINRQRAQEKKRNIHVDIDGKKQSERLKSTEINTEEHTGNERLATKKKIPEVNRHGFECTHVPVIYDKRSSGDGDSKICSFNSVSIFLLT